MQFISFIFLIGLASGNVINTNTEHSILRLPFRLCISFTDSFYRYYINTKFIYLKKRMFFIKEIGHVHHCTLSSKDYSSSYFKTINAINSLCHLVRTLLLQFKIRQKYTKDKT